MHKNQDVQSVTDDNINKFLFRRVIVTIFGRFDETTNDTQRPILYVYYLSRLW